MPELHFGSDAAETAREAAEYVVALAEDRTRAQGRFTVAFPGGSTPRGLFGLLASPPYAGRIAWERWHVFWGDERCIPPDHPDSNYRMAKEALLDRVPLLAEHIHRIRGEMPPQAAAQEYEEGLRQAFPASTPAFELILLGLGDDGHTASLFAGTDALKEERRLVVANRVPHLHTHRITFTLPLINAARAVAFLVTDGSKAGALSRVLEPPPGDPVLPAALVRPASGAVHWFLTRGAAQRLGALSA